MTSKSSPHLPMQVSACLMGSKLFKYRAVLVRVTGEPRRFRTKKPVFRFKSEKHGHYEEYGAICALILKKQ